MEDQSNEDVISEEQKGNEPLQELPINTQEDKNSENQNEKNHENPKNSENEQKGKNIRLQTFYFELV